MNRVSTYIGFLLIFSLLPMMGTAQAVTLQWDRNTEADTKEYDVYMCTPLSNCVVSEVASTRIGTVQQVGVGLVPSFVIPTNLEGKVGVSASDTLGNESPLSNIVIFDTKAPLAPVNLRLAP